MSEGNFTIPVDKALVLNWANWNSICESFPGLVCRENEATSSLYAHDTCGEDDPIKLSIPVEFSAVKVNGEYAPQMAHHGAILLGLKNGRILAMPPVEYDVKDEDTVAVFDPKEFPRFVPWRHRSGNYYVITGYANTPGKADYPPTIEYVNMHTGEKYSGRADDWHRRMTLVSL